VGEVEDTRCEKNRQRHAKVNRGGGGRRYDFGDHTKWSLKKRRIGGWGHKAANFNLHEEGVNFELKGEEKGGESFPEKRLGQQR